MIFIAINPNENFFVMITNLRANNRAEQKYEILLKDF